MSESPERSARGTFPDLFTIRRPNRGPTVPHHAELGIKTHGRYSQPGFPCSGHQAIYYAESEEPLQYEGLFPLSRQI